jgi:hypothetical protein
MTRNSATYTDMAIRRRPSSGLPAQVAGELYAGSCPVARSIQEIIEITSELDLIPR